MGTTSDENDALKCVYEATGIPIEQICGLMMPDDNLDELCEAILARFALPPKASPTRD